MEAGQLDQLLDDTIKGLCRSFPISGVALVFARTEEGVDCPLVAAGTAHGPLQASDAQTVRRLLIATTRFQEQLAIMLQHHQSRYSAYTAAEVEQQEQLLQRLRAETADCSQQLEDKKKTFARLEQQCLQLEEDIQTKIRSFVVQPSMKCNRNFDQVFEGGGTNGEGTRVSARPAEDGPQDGRQVTPPAG